MARIKIIILACIKTFININKMNMKKIIILLFLLNGLFSQYYSQTVTEKQERQTNTNILKTYSTSDTKSLQKYYQNLFSTKKDEKEKGLMPSFDIEKDKLLEKLRELIPMEGPVDPNTYYVGPGDLFNLSIWSDIPVTFSLIVSPEGTLIIPTVGVVDLTGKKLAEAKLLVEKKTNDIYKNSNVTLTLLIPRVFSVSVGGVVSNPGNYYASAVQRADQAIYLANLETKVSMGDLSKVNKEENQLINRSDLVQYFGNDELKKEKLEMSLRNIKILRKNGDTLDVDLVRYYATGNVDYNPFLLDGDQIFVPNLDLEANFITISGAVRLEGTYEYSKYDSISSVFNIAQGPTALADLENVNLYRTNFTDGRIEKHIINLAGILNHSLPDFKLKAGDKIIFRKKYPREASLDVTIKGEVISPGLYPILKDKTTIKDLIQEAGGFTSDASLAEAKIIRFTDPLDKALNNPDYKRLEEIRMSDLNARTREYYNFESAIKRDYAAVNFIELFEKNNEAYDIPLQNGDIILIPPKQKTIYVYGQVLYPGYYQYIEDKDYEYYLNLAGGTSDMADDSEIKIVKVGSHNWLDPEDTKMESGDAIWVPRDIDPRDKSVEFYYSWFQNAVTLVAGVATVILTIYIARK